MAKDEKVQVIDFIRTVNAYQIISTFTQSMARLGVEDFIGVGRESIFISYYFLYQALFLYIQIVFISIVYFNIRKFLGSEDRRSNYLRRDGRLDEDVSLRRRGLGYNLGYDSSDSYGIEATSRRRRYIYRSKVNRFLLVKTGLFCVSGSGVIRYLGGEVESCLRNVVYVRSSFKGRYFEVRLRLT